MAENLTLNQPIRHQKDKSIKFLIPTIYWNGLVSGALIVILFFLACLFPEDLVKNWITTIKWIMCWK